MAAIRNADGATPWPAQLLESEIRAQKDALTRAAAALRRQVERVQAAAGHIAVLDTHILLHYEPPESIDWTAIVGVSPVRLLLPMQVVDELDEKKYTGSDKVRVKARAVLTHIRALVGADGALGPVRDGVTIEVELTGEDRQQSDADKSIIDTCAELARLTGAANSVSLVTGDAGMLIRAAQREVRAVAMPDEYLRGASHGEDL
ncbi:MAG: PIN domain-containing protein [Solirubrobacteraceae bacterium]